MYMWVLLTFLALSVGLVLVFLQRKWLITHHEPFKNIAAGVQSVWVSAAIVIGGGWTLYVFLTLQTQEQANAQLENARKQFEQVQVQTQKLRDELVRQAVLDVDITGVQHARTARSEERILYGLVTIKNNGNKNTPIDWKGVAPFVAVPIRFGRAGQAIPDKQRAVWSPMVSEQTHWVLVGQTVRLPFAIKVPEAGLYYLEFQTNVSDEKQRGQNAIWAGRTCIDVP